MDKSFMTAEVSSLKC